MFKAGFPFEPFEGYKNKPREDLFALKEKSGHGKKVVASGIPLANSSTRATCVDILCKKTSTRI